MKVLLLSRYGYLGASSRVRFYQYLPYFRNQGIHVTMSNLLENDYLVDLYGGGRMRLSAIIRAYIRRLRYLLKSSRFNLLWVEYEILPWLPAWGETMLACMGIPYVVDYDDAVFHRYNMHPRHMVRTLLGDKIDIVMRRAALVIVGNDYLGDYAYKAGAKRVEHIPSVVDLDRYNSTMKQEDPVFTIGWIGSPATAKYLDIVHPALAEVCKKGSARLVLVGSGQFELDGVPAEIHPWSEETEVAEIQDFDVGIMPMPDEAWARGKCGYKLIQYMASARPVIASPVGVAREIVEDGRNGFFATTTTDWVNALSILRNKPGLREEMGKAGRKKVETHYCMQITAPRLASLLRSVTDEFK